MHATSARRGSSPGATRFSAGATAPTGSSTSSTRTATSSRSRGRSPRRPRWRPSRSLNRRPPRSIGVVLEIGEKAPLDATVWTTPRQRATIGDLLHGRLLLLLFYLFDWSATSPTEVEL